MSTDPQSRSTPELTEQTSRLALLGKSKVEKAAPPVPASACSGAC
jgi:PhoPQ-activated pathogenicity-related protein